MSKDTLLFKIRINEKPGAEYWINQLYDKGYEAVYIGYFGNEMLTLELQDYTGASIRPKDTKDRLALGVKFCKVAYANSELELIIELQNNALHDFWKSLVGVISEMEIIQVKSGNVVFNQSEWLDFWKQKLCRSGCCRQLFSLIRLASFSISQESIHI